MVQDVYDSRIGGRFMKYCLTMNEKQAQVTMDALDLYMRLRIGQWDELRKLCFEIPVSKDYEYEHIRDAVDEKLMEARQIIMPELTRGASWGVYKFPCTERAFNVLKAIRSARAWHNNPKGGYGCYYDSPMPIHVREEMPSCEVVDDAGQDKTNSSAD